MSKYFKTSVLLLESPVNKEVLNTYMSMIRITGVFSSLLIESAYSAFLMIFAPDFSEYLIFTKQIFP